MKSAGSGAVIDGVRAWLVDLASSGDALLEAESVCPRLSEEEIQRGRKLADRDTADDWLAAHIALRIVLERICGLSVRQRTFERSALGKPSLPSLEAVFSFSHAGRFALIAVGPSGPLGADMECPRVVRMSTSRQDAILTASRALSAQPLPASSPDMFLQAWVRLEALAKADGAGIGHILSEAGAFGPRLGKGCRNVNDSGLVVRDLAAGEGVFASIAYDAGTKFLGLNWLPTGPDMLHAFAAGEEAAGPSAR